jgi:hypothetical protein
MVGLAIKITPENPINDDNIYLFVIFSPRNKKAKKTTTIGEISINEIASPKGKYNTPKNQTIFVPSPKIPLKYNQYYIFQSS